MRIPLKEGIRGKREGDFTNNANNYIIFVYGIIPSAWLFCQGWLAGSPLNPKPSLFLFAMSRLPNCKVCKAIWLLGYYAFLSFSFLPSFFPSLSFPLFVCLFVCLFLFSFSWWPFEVWSLRVAPFQNSKFTLSNYFSQHTQTYPNIPLQNSFGKKVSSSSARCK